MDVKTYTNYELALSELAGALQQAIFKAQAIQHLDEELGTDAGKDLDILISALVNFICNDRQSGSVSSVRRKFYLKMDQAQGK